MSRTKRPLSPRLSSDDKKVWRHVTRGIRPLQPQQIDDEEPAPLKKPDDKPARRKAALEIPAPPPAPAPRIPAPLNFGSTADIDRRTAQRFKRGEMAVDGRIDLHGLTLDQAHGALTSFIRGAAARGARCVVVVTGKGKGGSIGKIRNETPHWLNQAPLRPLILAVTQAGVRDGGAGALYVLLKRKRA